MLRKTGLPGIHSFVSPNCPRLVSHLFGSRSDMTDTVMCGCGEGYGLVIRSTIRLQRMEIVLRCLLILKRMNKSGYIIAHGLEIDVRNHFCGRSVAEERIPRCNTDHEVGEVDNDRKQLVGTIEEGPNAENLTLSQHVVDDNVYYCKELAIRAFSEFQPVAAVLGEPVTQDVINMLARRENPLNNSFSTVPRGRCPFIVCEWVMIKGVLYGYLSGD